MDQETPRPASAVGERAVPAGGRRRGGGIAPAKSTSLLLLGEFAVLAPSWPGHGCSPQRLGFLCPVSFPAVPLADPCLFSWGMPEDIENTAGPVPPHLEELWGTRAPEEEPPWRSVNGEQEVEPIRLKSFSDRWHRNRWKHQEMRAPFLSIFARSSICSRSKFLWPPFF